MTREYKGLRISTIGNCKQKNDIKLTLLDIFRIKLKKTPKINKF